MKNTIGARPKAEGPKTEDRRPKTEKNNIYA